MKAEPVHPSHILPEHKKRGRPQVQERVYGTLFSPKFVSRIVNRTETKSSASFCNKSKVSEFGLISQLIPRQF